LVGPAVNAALAGIFGVLFVKIARPDLPVFFTSTAQWSVSAQVLFYASVVNVGLFVFNMIPVPPLDGSVLFERLLPARWWPTYLKYRQYTMPILLGLVVLNFLFHPGPLSWLFNRLYSWWEGVLGV
jgi:Zn-dependent protease